MRIRNCHSSSLFKKHSLLKFEDKIQLENVLLVSKYFNNILPSIFDNWSTLGPDLQNYDTADISTGKLFKPLFQSDLYGKNSITITAANAWIYNLQLIQTAFGDVILKNSTTVKVGLALS